MEVIKRLLLLWVVNRVCCLVLCLLNDLQIMESLVLQFRFSVLRAYQIVLIVVRLICLFRLWNICGKKNMGSIFAVLTAQYIGGIDNLIMVSPTHVPFEGTSRDKKTMTGHSVVTWHGEDVPFVKADFSGTKASKYQKHSAVSYKVMGMWTAYYNAYQDKEEEKAAWLQLEKTNARILLIAGAKDEAWPAEYSVKVLEQYLKAKNYQKDVKAIIYPCGSHLNGLMPNREREKKLYRMIPLIGFMYKSFGKHRKENMKYFEQSEKEIIEWIKA